MSFDFDPNENIDRAEVDNNPQDIESYVGGEGLFGRVPGGPQVGAADRSQGQPLGDQGLPIERRGLVVGLCRPEEVGYQGVPDKPQAY